MSKRIPILLGLVLVFIAIWLLITPNKFVRLLVERLQNLGYDLQLRTRVLTKQTKTLSPVAIIDIDDKSLKSEGRWPWPRERLATLVDELQRYGASVIVFDMFFSEKEANIAQNLLKELTQRKMLNIETEKILKQSEPLFDEDIQFAKSLSLAQSVLALGFLPRNETENVLPNPLIMLPPKMHDQLALIRASGYISNIPQLQQAAKGGGFINVFPDSDGIVRRSPLLIEYKNGLYPSLALQTVITLLNENIKLITPAYGQGKKLEGIQIGEKIVPTDERAQVLIPFVGKSYTFPYYSAIDVLNRHIPKDALNGKILLIGTSATGLGDLQATAIENPFPGVEIQATLINGMLGSNFSYIPAWTFGANLFLTIFLGLIAAFLFPYLGPRTLGLIIILLPPGLLFLNNWIWEAAGLILSVLMPVLLILIIALLNIIYGYLFETRRRERLKEMFGQYVPEKHIDEMLRTTSNYALRGEDRDMSVLFADIRGFTTISETLSAAELVKMLNTFFNPMTEIIFKHRGTIDKYVGDLIMAFWGAPLKDKNHARHAIESALEMQKKLKNMHTLFAEHNWPEVKLGIGINSGIMSVGDMGSKYRRNYTVLGDTVNLASRIEGLTKFYGATLVVTENTKKNQTKFIFRQLDRVRVKGKTAAIAIFEVLGFKADLTPELIEELEIYHKALDFYFQQKWDDAEILMTQLHQAYRHKKIYHLYLERIKEFKHHELPADWDGVYVHLSK